MPIPFGARGRTAAPARLGLSKAPTQAAPKRGRDGGSEMSQDERAVQAQQRTLLRRRRYGKQVVAMQAKASVLKRQPVPRRHGSEGCHWRQSRMAERRLDRLRIDRDSGRVTIAAASVIVGVSLSPVFAVIASGRVGRGRVGSCVAVAGGRRGGSRSRRPYDRGRQRAAHAQHCVEQRHHRSERRENGAQRNHASDSIIAQSEGVGGRPCIPGCTTVCRLEPREPP